MSFSQPDYHLYEEFLNRSQRVKEIREMGLEPYPHTYHVDHSLSEIIQHHLNEMGDSEAAKEGKTPFVKIAGRLVLFRPMGKNAFGQIQDENARLQIMFNREETVFSGLGENALKFIEKKIDLGDILGLTGHLFRTHKGELTLFVKECTLLCKALLPLPDKHSGLADKGLRYRKRWLDCIAHPQRIEQFKIRSHILKLTRQFFEEKGFLEVETPVLQNVYGGAAARPFLTHLHALDQEMYLRISLEIPLKKLIVGGFRKVFEIGKVFRNEGIDRTHNPEFTELEAYLAYADYRDMMVLTEELFQFIALTLFQTTEITTFDSEGTPIKIDVKAPWKRLSMKEAIHRFACLDIDQLSDAQMRAHLLQKTEIPEEEVQKASRGNLILLLFEQFAEKQLIQPHHIIDHPIETTPLCKPHRNPSLYQGQFVERFESFINGQEFCNSYTELNDPQIQRQLLLEQAEKKLSGDEEASPLDEEFIESICQGMPPTGGLGIGMDRLVMLFTQAASIRDVLLFPLMKQEE
jgi:lysyl-tRNA synthetase, class II